MSARPTMVPASRIPVATPETAKVVDMTEEAAIALQSVRLFETAPGIPGARSIALSIPLDSRHDSARNEVTTKGAGHIQGTRQVHTTYRHSEPVARDSLKRRDALLKGKEGSRQRRRWENDRLLNNPWAQPPLPIDWEIHPTYPRHAVPYYLAPLWDAGAFERSVERKMKGKNWGRRAGISPTEEAASNVPKEIRSKLKHARAAKGLLQDLEEEVRVFLETWNPRKGKSRDDGLRAWDSEEEEIVFVGRNGQMHGSLPKEGTSADQRRDKLVFDGLADDRGASFCRWLVHSIATYYGLRSWSMTVGDPARREAYVGLGDTRSAFTSGTELELPRPLWGMV